MLRVFLTIVLPLVAPTAIYLAWLQVARWSRRGVQPAEPVHWAALPWVWLMGTGTVLLAIVLFVVTVHFGTPQPGFYVPPRWEDGRIIPGHVDPGRSP